MIIAIDPGSVRTGVAMFTYDKEKRRANLGVLQVLQSKETDALIAMLSKGEGNHTVVLEDFKHAMATGNFRGRKSAQMAHDERLTHALAKRIKGATALGGHHLVIQEPSVLAMGRKWCDLKCPKTGHIPDEISAYIHGAHFLVKSQWIDAVKDITKFGQELIEAD